LDAGVGPILIAKTKLSVDEIDDKLIALPGEHTTAHVLFSLAFPNAKKKVFKVFNQIEDAVLNGEVDCGVIIHENRFTYQAKGLTKLIDLGDYWEMKTGLPIPLGGIVARKSLDDRTIEKIDALIVRALNLRTRTIMNSSRIT
jgi:1,4-dihydroxy-6-naphthoate synthase